MNAPTNAIKSRSTLYQLTPRDMESRSGMDATVSSNPMGVQSRECIVSFRHEHSHQAHQGEFDPWTGNWDWDIRTDETVWSEQLYWIIGRDENAGIPPFKDQSCFYTSESWVRLVDATLGLLQTGVPYELGLQMLHADGTRRWIIRRGEAVHGECGDIVQLRGTVRDVSHWRRHVAKDQPERQSKSNDSPTGRLIQAQEEENVRLASKLRDNISQRVSLLVVSIQTLSSALPQLSPQAATQLEEIRQESSRILTELDRVSDELYPFVLDLLGLPLAVQRLCRDFTKESGIPVEYISSDLSAESVDQRCALALFRVLEEALVNIVQHGRASKVAVHLDRDSTELRLRVSDNGVGFERGSIKTAAGLGFVRMKERVRQVGGSLAVWSQQACGTFVEARAPLWVAQDRGLRDLLPDTRNQLL
jgi:two-component system sensor histidine kinase UhpB